MANFEQSFMNFLLEHQEKHNRTHNFLILMEGLTVAAKRIQHNYATGALQDNLGRAGATNVQGEEVMQLDQIAHEIVVYYLRRTRRVMHAISEEVEEVIELEGDDGRYIVYFDPLDGSSNIPHSLPVGFMFGIAKRNLDGPEDGHLRQGGEFIAAGMFLFPSGTFTFSLRDAGTWRFHLDETMEYVKPIAVRLPERAEGTWELSYNVANIRTYTPGVQAWIGENGPSFNFRYIGALAGDVHRLLGSGGMFMYPAIVDHPNPAKNRPDGKLRLLYEAAVVAFMCKESGGRAVDESGRDILDVVPVQPHQRTALYVGSAELVDSIAGVLHARN